jgi:hypothetical protein
MAARVAPLLSREEALRRRALRQAWGWLLFGLLVPFAALVAVHTGYVHRAASPRQGLALMALGVAVFTIRLALFVV